MREYSEHYRPHGLPWSPNRPRKPSPSREVSPRRQPTSTMLDARKTGPPLPRHLDHATAVQRSWFPARRRCGCGSVSGRGPGSATRCAASIAAFARSPGMSYGTAERGTGPGCHKPHSAPSYTGLVCHRPCLSGPGCHKPRTTEAGQRPEAGGERRRPGPERAAGGVGSGSPERGIFRRIERPQGSPGRPKMSDPRAIFEQTSKMTGHPGEFRFE